VRRHADVDVLGFVKSSLESGARAFGARPPGILMTLGELRLARWP
jgi:hypothetical protein